MYLWGNCVDFHTFYSFSCKFLVFLHTISIKSSNFAKELGSMEQNQIVIYQTEDGRTQIDVRLENETVWLTQAQMVQLFKSSRTNILEHILSRI